MTPLLNLLILSALWMISCQSKPTSTNPVTSDSSSDKPLSASISFTEKANELNPQTLLEFTLGSQKHAILADGDCKPIAPDAFQDNEVPEVADAACHCWWAGSGTDFYVKNNGNDLQIFRKYTGEGDLNYWHVVYEILTYESATVYAAATDYSFKDAKDHFIEIRVNDLDENPVVSLPGNLLESDVAEGPPGANPDLVGKRMRVTYGPDNEVNKIRIDAESQNILLETGASLADIQAINEKPFMLVGFEVDGEIAGKAVDWKGGKLTGRVVQFGVTEELPTEEYQQIMGDDLFSSENPIMKKAKLKVIFVD